MLVNPPKPHISVIVTLLLFCPVNALFGFWAKVPHACSRTILIPPGSQTSPRSLPAAPVPRVSSPVRLECLAVPGDSPWSVSPLASTSISIFARQSPMQDPYASTEDECCAFSSVCWLSSSIDRY
ncbi:hypothetical protein C8R45DRAFT_545557 [Mycena sanguinolenta]|nr:hypothetical protein C8R45DRAFT_545557 [Mycena sanguinolenta]